MPACHATAARAPQPSDAIDAAVVMDFGADDMLAPAVKIPIVVAIFAVTVHHRQTGTPLALAPRTGTPLALVPRRGHHPLALTPRSGTPSALAQAERSPRAVVLQEFDEQLGKDCPVPRQYVGLRA